MMPKFLSQVPLGSFEHEDGGKGLSLTYEWLTEQLRLGGKMGNNEVISQVNVAHEGIVLFVKEEK